MMKQGQAKWFTNADEMMQHYKEVQNRLNPPKKTRIRLVTPKVTELPMPKPKPVVVAPPPVEEPVDKITNMHDFLNAIREHRIFRSRANAARLAALMEAHYGLPKGSLLGRSHLHAIVKVRRELYYYLVRVFEFGWSEAAKAIDRDHTTILYGVRRYEEWLNGQIG